MTEKIQEIIQRVAAGKGDEADLQVIAAALRAGEVVLATGDRAIAIGGDANDSVNVTGNRNQVIVLKGAESEAIAPTVEADFGQQFPNRGHPTFVTLAE